MTKKQFREWCEQQRQEAYEKRNEAQQHSQIDYWFLRIQFFDEVIKKFTSTKG